MRPIILRLLLASAGIAVFSPARAADAPPAHPAAATLVLTLPDGAAVRSAVATNRDVKLDAPGKVDARTVTFDKLLPDTPYDVTLALDDGRVLQGVNMDWYGMDLAKPGAAPLSDDDRAQVATLVTDVKAFENKKRVLATAGDATRCTALVELIRDVEFHASGGNVTWRVELWYFRNEFGGWAKVSQQNKVLRRERFKTRDAMDAVVSKLAWVPRLGGLRVPKGQPRADVTLPPEALRSPAPPSAGG